MKNNSSLKWVYVGLLTMIAILLIVLICVLKNKKEYSLDKEDEPKVYVQEDDAYQSDESESQLQDQSFTDSTSLDWKMRGLRGRVKHISETKEIIPEYGESQTIHKTIRFDRNGTYLPENSSQVTITRNGKGQIIKEVEVEHEEGRKITYTSQYKFTNEGFVKYESEQVKSEFGDVYVDYYNYTVNNNGWPISAKVKSDGDWEESVHSILKFSYSDIDDHGNWRKSVTKQYQDDEFQGKAIVTRQITYWD